MGRREVDNRDLDPRDYLRNFIREEIDREPWPELLSDQEADLEREISRLEDRLVFWRTSTILLLFGFVIIFILFLLGEV